MVEKLISVKGLQKYYTETTGGFFKKNYRIKAVDGVDFDIFRGETFGLLGESGCGKSTTAQLLAQLLAPTAGEIRYRGEDISKLSGRKQKQLKKHIQIVFQDPYASLNPKKKIAWLLEEPLVINKVLSNKAERQRAVAEMLQTVGLDESFGEYYPHQLSGGQRQRVSIAIALMLRPEFIIADEPVSALDVSVQAQILNLLQKLQVEFKLTYFFISHDLNVVGYMSDRIGVMYLGRMVEIGSTQDIFNQPVHPYTRTLFATLPILGGNKPVKSVLPGDGSDFLNAPAGCLFYPRCPQALPVCRENPPPVQELGNGRRVWCHRK